MGLGTGIQAMTLTRALPRLAAGGAASLVASLGGVIGGVIGRVVSAVRAGRRPRDRGPGCGRRTARPLFLEGDDRTERTRTPLRTTVHHTIQADRAERRCFSN